MESTLRPLSNMADFTLCEKCAKFNLKAALRYYDPSATQVLFLGPFAEPIEKTKCELCKVARHAVGCQDGHAEQTLRLKRSRVGTLVVERLIRGRWSGCAYLSASADAESYWYVMEDVDVALRRLEDDTLYAPGTEMPMAWYETYGKDVAVRNASSWMGTCAADHQQSCPYPPRSGSIPDSFFVDVEHECIVSGSVVKAEPYFALSYVCGGYKGLELDSRNLVDLQEPGSLRVAGLPPTYTDALSFTKDCAVRYIWIDFLCIMHDEQGPRQTQIEAMDQIYSQASLVLIAALGSTPSFGLFPRSVKPRKIQGVLLHIERCTADNAPSAHLVDEMGSTYWNRSWCFQEQFLSTRRLYLGAHWFRFECRSMNVMGHLDKDGEVVVQNVQDVKHAITKGETWAVQCFSQASMCNSDVTFSELFRAYSMIVEGYTARELGWPEDIERAFAGFSSTLSRIPDTEIVSCIPSIVLPYALLWSSKDDRPVSRSGGSASFPSYSWTSCKGAVSYDDLHKNIPTHDPIDRQPSESLAKGFMFEQGLLRFEALAIGAEHFAIDLGEIKLTGSEDDMSEDNRGDSLQWYLYPRHGDLRTRIGWVSGLAKGHDACFCDKAAAVTPNDYLVVPLISTDTWCAVESRVPFPGLVGRVSLGLVVLRSLNGDLRVGMVAITAAAFDGCEPSAVSFGLV
jgi:hypothetical protein